MKKTLPLNKMNYFDVFLYEHKNRLITIAKT